MATLTLQLVLDEEDLNDEDQAEGAGGAGAARPVQLGMRKSDGNLCFNTADLEDMLKEDAEHDPLILTLEGVWARGLALWS